VDGGPAGFDTRSELRSYPVSPDTAQQRGRRRRRRRGRKEEEEEEEEGG